MLVVEELRVWAVFGVIEIPGSAVPRVTTTLLLPVRLVADWTTTVAFPSPLEVLQTSVSGNVVLVVRSSGLFVPAFMVPVPRASASNPPSAKAVLFRDTDESIMDLLFIERSPRQRGEAASDLVANTHIGERKAML
jgi:hypothetical protein